MPSLAINGGGRVGREDRGSAGRRSAPSGPERGATPSSSIRNTSGLDPVRLDQPDRNLVPSLKTRPKIARSSGALARLGRNNRWAGLMIESPSAPLSLKVTNNPKPVTPLMRAAKRLPIDPARSVAR